MTILKEIKPTFLFPSLYFFCLLFQFPQIFIYYSEGGAPF